MALEISSGSALTVALDSWRAVSRLVRSGRISFDAAQGLALSNGIVAGRFVERSVAINLPDANRTLRQSVFAGASIREALLELADLARVAGQDGLVSSETNLTINGTRVSRGNIQTQIDRAIVLINNLTQATTVRGGSFINGNSLPFQLQTTKFGGSLTINPQGLDPFSLGISRLDVSTSETARLSEARLRGAAQTVGSRLERLSQLQAALGQTNGFDQSLISASANISGAVPIGALVNLSG